jgi:hypothetical protein
VFLLGWALTGVFLYWETRCANPLVPLNLFFHPQFSLMVGLVCLGALRTFPWLTKRPDLASGFVSFSPNFFYISILMQTVTRYSPLHTSVALMPQAVAGVLVNVVAAFVLHRVDKFGVPQ